MPQVPGIRPVHEGHLADQLRGDPAALRHFLCSERLAPPRRPFLGQICEGALRSYQPLQSGKDFVSNSGHKAVFHLRHKEERLVFVNAHEQGIEAVRTRDVTANDELLLPVRAVLSSCLIARQARRGN